jgi:hypothetical protein
MFDEQSIKEKLLDELMEELGKGDADKIRPKGMMAVSVENKPGDMMDDSADAPDLGMGQDSDEINPEDLKKLLQLLG